MQIAVFITTVTDKRYAYIYLAPQATAGIIIAIEKSRRYISPSERPEPINTADEPSLFSIDLYGDAIIDAIAVHMYNRRHSIVGDENVAFTVFLLKYCGFRAQPMSANIIISMNE